MSQIVGKTGQINPPQFLCIQDNSYAHGGLHEQGCRIHNTTVDDKNDKKGKQRRGDGIRRKALSLDYDPEEKPGSPEGVQPPSPEGFSCCMIEDIGQVGKNPGKKDHKDRA